MEFDPDMPQFGRPIKDGDYRATLGYVQDPSKKFPGAADVSFDIFCDDKNLCPEGNVRVGSIIRPGPSLKQFLEAFEPEALKQRCNVKLATYKGRECVVTVASKEGKTPGVVFVNVVKISPLGDDAEEKHEPIARAEDDLPF